MQKTLIDFFIVPEESKHEFLEQAHRAQAFIRTLPGFVEGYIYEHSEGDSPYNFITTAVWQSEDAFEQAKQSVFREYARRDYHPQEALAHLNVRLSRASFTRAHY